jgi:hypothetical protein
MMKSGASKLDQSSIRQFEGEGKTAGWISQKMQIPLKCVENFMTAVKEPEISPQQRAANTRKANAEALNNGDGETAAA